MPSMDAIITGLGDIRVAMGRDESRQDDALDILHDYRLQAKQYSALQRKHEVAGKPIFKDGVWHCPDCNGRTSPNHSFCHRCGKKLGWR